MWNTGEYPRTDETFGVGGGGGFAPTYLGNEGILYRDLLCYCSTKLISLCLSVMVLWSSPIFPCLVEISRLSILETQYEITLKSFL